MEWIEKAEGDYYSALREYRARKNPNYDSACFHAQQCVEKYFKAYLQKANIFFSKTHDLNVLLDLVLPKLPLWEVYRKDLKMVSNYAVEVRYPGEFAQKEEAKETIRVMKQIRKEFRILFDIN